MSAERSQFEPCSICMLRKPLLVSPCNHKACQQCLERIFLTSSPHNFNHDQDDEEALQDKIVHFCPSRSRCPFCRNPINMFHLKYEHKEGMISSPYHELGESSLVYEKNKDMKDSPLNDLVFSDNSVECKAISFEDGVPNLVFYRYEGNNKKLFRRQRFHEYFYHEKSLTFYGAIQWNEESKECERILKVSTEEPNVEPESEEEGKRDIQNEPWEGADCWEVIIQFSLDFRYSKHGAIIKRRMNDDVFNQTRYPLDGKWHVRHIYDPTISFIDVDFNNTPSLTVVCNRFTFCDVLYSICLGSERVFFDWPVLEEDTVNIRQEAECGIDLKINPEGPRLGSVIVWNVNHPDYHRILWKRATIGQKIPPLQLEIVGRFGTKFCVEGNRPLARNEHLSYNSSSPCGNVFIQGHKVGLASYHFVSFTGEGTDGVYISYEHERCAAWPALDDGSPVPLRVPFVSISYDETTRTFRGKIPWMEAYGTTWQGNSEWDYEMVFDNEFTCIKSGCVLTGSSDFYTSQYGEDLNYYNAAIVEIIKSGSSVTSTTTEHLGSANVDENNDRPTTLISPHNNGSIVRNNQEHANENITRQSQDGERPSNVRSEVLNQVRTYKKHLIERLHNEGVKPRTLTLVSHAAAGAIDQSLNPIDYNGMTFNP